MTIKTILRPEELAKQLGISKTTLWRWRRAKIIIEPIAFGSRLIGWRISDIEDWLEQMKNGEIK